MSVTSLKTVTADKQNLSRTFREKFFAWFIQAWEIYPILLLATFFRVFAIDKVMYADDQAAMFALARDAIAHHILPASSNRSSVGILHGPFPTYFYMLVAAFTGNPMWAALETGLFNVLGVLVTYLFVRRYYGRFAGTLAAGLYAVTTAIVLFNRFIWQPNLAPPLVILLMFVLFWGAVERRKGWLVPAAILLGVLYETHESGGYMLLPTIMAFLLAVPLKTIRWRDIALAAIALAIIFLPYGTWLFASHFADVKILLATRHRPASVNNHVYLIYGFFASPYIQTPSNWANAFPTDPRSLLMLPLPFMPFVQGFLRVVHDVLPWSSFAGGLTIFLLLFRRSRTPLPTLADDTTRLNLWGRWLRALSAHPHLGKWVTWLRALYDDPTKRGYLLLLVWQGIIPLFLIRYTVPLGGQYLTFLLPGPSILTALFLSKSLELTGQWRPRWHVFVRPLVYTITGLVLIAEIIGSVTLVVDTNNGAYDSFSYYPIYYNDAPSLRNAVIMTEQLAEQRHIQRIYISANLGVSAAMHYYTQQMPLPVTIFDNNRCDVLPNPATGPVVFLLAPYSPVAEALIHQYTNATLIAQPGRVGGDPFKLYILQSKPITTPVHNAFTDTLQLRDPYAHHLTVTAPPPVGTNWMVTHWSINDTQQPDWRTTYDYVFETTFNQPGGSPLVSECTMTRAYQGDQLFATFPIAPSQATPTSLTIDVKDLIYRPLIVHAGPIPFLTFNDALDLLKPLQTPDGKTTIVLPGS